MTDIDMIRDLVSGDSGLATISLARDDGSVHSSVVNAGVLDHPVSGDSVVGVVVRGSSWKLRRLRSYPHATVLFRVGWTWGSASGPVDIIGPDDAYDGFDTPALPQLLRDVFIAAGGTHDDWVEYDRVMAAERRTALLVHPETMRGVRPR